MTGKVVIVTGTVPGVIDASAIIQSLGGAYTDDIHLADGNATAVGARTWKPLLRLFLDYDGEVFSLDDGLKHKYVEYFNRHTANRDVVVVHDIRFLFPDLLEEVLGVCSNDIVVMLIKETKTVLKRFLSHTSGGDETKQLADRVYELIDSFESRYKDDDRIELVTVSDVSEESISKITGQEYTVAKQEKEDANKDAMGES